MFWEQVPEKYGKWNSIYRKFLRWSAKGIFEKIFRHFSQKIKKRNTAMLDSTYVKAHRTVASLASDGQPRLIGRSHGGITTKIHLLCNELEQPIDFRITGGQVNDAKIAPDLPATWIAYKISWRTRHMTQIKFAICLKRKM